MIPDQTQQLHDIEAIREWLAKEPHLPKDDINNLLMRKFLHSCYWSLERTKECIEKFCTYRCYINEIYIGRDPLSANMRNIFSIVNFAVCRTPSNQDVIIQQLNDPGLEKFVYCDVMKAFSMMGECYLNFHDSLPKEHIVILDMKDYTMKVIPKLNLMVMRAILTYILEGAPVRLTQFHLINCAPITDKLFSIVKPMLPVEICDLVKFHSTLDSLHKIVDKKSLPIDYGGEAESMCDQNKKWIKEVENNRELFMNDNYWKSDLKKRRKVSSCLNELNGSFRTLEVD